MKEERNLICSIIIFLMVVFFRFLLPVYADDAVNMGIYDDADLFSAAQESDIGEEIQKVILQTGFDVAVVTTNNAQGKSAQKYADYFYTTKKIGKGDKKSGVLFLIDMDNREIYFYTKGDAMRYFSDKRQKKIVDTAYSDVKAQQYARCAQSVIADVSYYYSQGTVKKQYFVFGDSFLESGDQTRGANIACGIFISSILLSKESKEGVFDGGTGTKIKATGVDLCSRCRIFVSQSTTSPH